MSMTSSSEKPWKQTWRKFKKNPLGMAGLIFILLIALVSFCGPFIRPDATVNANDQNLVLSSKKPGFTVQTLHLKLNDEHPSFWETWVNGGTKKSVEELPFVKCEFVNPDSLRAFLYSGDTLMITAANLGVQRIPEYTEELYHYKTFLFGTDKYGRDVLSRLMAGSSISLAVGAIAVLISLLVGLTLGIVAGYYRGWTDKIIMWFTNVIWAVPTLLLVMAITFAFGTGFWKVFLAVGLTMWVEVARIARGQVLSVREKEFVEAARALGYSEIRIMFKHILPNILSPIIVISAANFASAILIEAGLSFLGLGAQIPTPSWGNMIREHYAFITTDLAYLALLPGILIMLLVLAFMLVGNALRDALDERNTAN